LDIASLHHATGMGRHNIEPSYARKTAKERRDQQIQQLVVIARFKPATLCRLDKFFLITIHSAHKKSGLRQVRLYGKA
jgi:DNA-binding FadR family transcriptional regulator